MIEARLGSSLPWISLLYHNRLGAAKNLMSHSPKVPVPHFRRRLFVLELAAVFLVAFLGWSRFWGRDRQVATLPEPGPAQAFAYTGELRIPLKVAEEAGIARRADPVTSGVPLPEAAAIVGAGELALVDGENHAVAAQFTVMSRWNGPVGGNKPLRRGLGG